MARIKNANRDDLGEEIPSSANIAQSRHGNLELDCFYIPICPLLSYQCSRVLKLNLTHTQYELIIVYCYKYSFHSILDSSIFTNCKLFSRFSNRRLWLYFSQIQTIINLYKASCPNCSGNYGSTVEKIIAV